MTDFPPLQHWLVPLARQAGLPGADTLAIDSNADTAEAWSAVAMATHTTEDALAEVVSLHFGLERANFAETQLGAVPLLPYRVAARLGVLCLACTDREVVVATADPVAFEAEQEIHRLTSRHVRFCIAPPASVADALAHAYPDADRAPDLDDPLPALLPDDTPHILVVDDDAGMRLLLRTVLQSRNFRVTEAADGPSALERLEEGGFHLVTLDLSMGAMGGLEVLERIRSRLMTRTLPVIVATGTEDPEVEMQLFEAGADDFVVKPIDPPRFVLRVQAVLRRRDQIGHPLLA